MEIATLAESRSSTVQGNGELGFHTPVELSFIQTIVLSPTSSHEFRNEVHRLAELASLQIEIK